MMKVPRYILAQAIAERTMHIEDSKNLATEIAAYLLAERRTAELESILRDVLQYRQDHGGIMEANIVTAHQTDKDVLEDVEQLLHRTYPSAKTIHLNQVEDASVIGGIRLDLPNEQLDMTVKAKLSKFKSLTGAGEKI